MTTVVAIDAHIDLIIAQLVAANPEADDAEIAAIFGHDIDERCFSMGIEPSATARAFMRSCVIARLQGISVDAALARTRELEAAA